jgi:hypothetical protein
MRQLGPFSFCSFLHPRACRALGVTLALLALGGPALADDDAPFQMEPSSWMSFDRYKEKPANWIAPDERAQAALQPVVVPPPLTPAGMPVITAPTRAIETPALPGLNKDFDVRVNSTEDDNWKPSAAFTNLNTVPDMDLQDNWQDAAKAARLNKDKKQILETVSGHPAYDVRLSYLPTRITPIPKATPAKKPELAQTPIPPAVAETAATAPKAKPKPVVDAAACAALDAYKKRQLAAIESDRKTLAALQNAIAQLGLGKQLNFMNGADGSLGMQQATSSPNADPPATTKTP